MPTFPYTVALPRFPKQRPCPTPVTLAVATTTSIAPPKTCCLGANAVNNGRPGGDDGRAFVTSRLRPLGLHNCLCQALPASRRHLLCISPFTSVQTREETSRPGAYETSGPEGQREKKLLTARHKRAVPRLAIAAAMALGKLQMAQGERVCDHSSQRVRRR